MACATREPWSRFQENLRVALWSVSRQTPSGSPSHGERRDAAAGVHPLQPDPALGSPPHRTIPTNLMSDAAPRFTEAELTAVSRLLSKVLRHEPGLVALRLDHAGWARVDDLLEGIRKAARAPNASKRVRALPAVTLEMLIALVESNNKQRFSLSPDGQRIRAVQGHSVAVELGHPIVEPPAVLYHGTAAASWRAIATEGLKPGSRHAVHLSEDAVTAERVGARHGRPVVLTVAAKRMHDDGFRFALSDNGMWLVSAVPPKYLALRR